MPKEKTELIRKVSAVLVSNIIQNRVADLVPDTVPVGSMILGFNPVDPEHEADVLAVDDDKTREWTQHTTEPFLLRTWGAHKVEKPDEETGEVRVWVRVVLIDAAGDTLSFGSKGILRSLDLLRALRGDGPYDPPLPIIIHHIPLADGKQYLKIRLLLNHKKTEKK